MAVQLVDYINDNDLGESLQSAYKRHHSTESALLKVHNDILKAVDNLRTVVLLLLDLSSAFDTVDHGILINRLESRFGIKGKALQCFRSYLENRLQYVCINGSNSSSTDVAFGVPQGSVLGPILYLLYTSPLGDIMEWSFIYMLMIPRFIFPLILLHAVCLQWSLAFKPVYRISLLGCR